MPLMADAEKKTARDPAAETQRPESGEASTKKKPLAGKRAGKRHAPVCHGGICYPNTLAESEKEI
jgi:aminoglycoside phosphotransferase